MSRSMKGHDYSKEARCTALGARLCRLSEQLDPDYSHDYMLNGVASEQRWLGVLTQLDLNGPLSIGDLATLLGITHVSVTQTCQFMTKRNCSCRQHRSPRRGSGSYGYRGRVVH